MKVLHILAELRPSGAEVMLKIAAPYWCKNDYEMSVLSTGEDIGTYSNILNEVGYKIYHIPFQKSFGFFNALRRLIVQEAFDVVHIHTERANFYYGILCKHVGVPAIIRTIHSVFNFQGRLKTTRMFQRWFLRAIGIKQVSIGTSVQENEIKTFKNPTTLISNWYDDQRFYPVSLDQKMLIRKELNIIDSQVVIVSVGNCSSVKNHHAIIEALANLEKNDKVIYLHIGEEDAEQTERHLAKRLNLLDQIHFLGFQEDIRPYLWAADIFLMPSLYEGLGIAAVEAMAAGLPCILSDVPGLKDFKGIIPGIIFTTPTKEGIKTSVEELSKKNLYDLLKLGSVNSEIVKKYWGVEQNCQKYLDLYKLKG